MPDEIAESIPRVGVGVDVRHARTQTGLQLGGMPVEEVHNHRPRYTCEHGPSVMANSGAAIWF